MRFAATRRVSGGSVVGQMDTDGANGYTRCDEVEKLGLFSSALSGSPCLSARTSYADPSQDVSVRTRKAIRFSKDVHCPAARATPRHLRCRGEAAALAGATQVGDRTTQAHVGNDTIRPDRPDGIDPMGSGRVLLYLRKPRTIPELNGSRTIAGR
jgi:hypothetical protein